MVQHDEKKTTMKMLSAIVLHKGEGTQLNLDEESMRGQRYMEGMQIKNHYNNTNCILIPTEIYE